MVSCESGQVGDITCFRTGTASQWVEHDFSINLKNEIKFLLHTVNKNQLKVDKDLK
jgi:hypothetical protein